MQPTLQDSSAALLRIDRLDKQYDGINAVSGVSFAIQRGTVTGLIGPNGAGKTTTFDMIAGATRPSSGAIWFRDRDVTAFPSHRMFRMGLARTFQIPRPFGRMTVLENLMTAPLHQRGEQFWTNWILPGSVRREEYALRDRARDVLRFLDLEKLGEEEACNLSGGQMKLLELGRALMSDPELILLDEPGAGVNPFLLNTIMDRIHRLNEQGMTFFIIEHNMEVVMNLCDPVLVMSEGDLLLQGTCREVCEDDRVIEAFLGSRMADDNADQ